MHLVGSKCRLEAAGVFSIVLECIPAEVAKLVSEAVCVPTIGIGAGPDCDGQILVYQDMLGMFSDFTPKFVKRYADIGSVMKEAFRNYIEETRSGAFPEHKYGIADEVLQKLY